MLEIEVEMSQTLMTNRLAQKTDESKLKFRGRELRDFNQHGNARSLRYRVEMKPLHTRIEREQKIGVFMTTFLR